MFNHPNFIALSSIVHKEISRYTRIWVQTLLPSSITMTLYFVIFGNLIGSRIGQMGGYSYMEFIVPGLIMMSVITNSYSNVVSSFFSTKFQRSIEEIMVAPVPNVVILMGYVAGGVSRGMITGLIVTLVSLFFVDIEISNPLLVIMVVVLTSIMFSLAGFVNAVFAKSFDDISIVPTFILTPLTYLGGVFYSISLLPEFWQIPHSQILREKTLLKLRYGFLGTSDINIWVAVALILFFIISLASVAMFLLSRGIGLRS